MKIRNEVHTLPEPQGDGWRNEWAGSVIGIYPYRDQAVRAGRKIAEAEHVPHVIHRADGSTLFEHHAEVKV